MASSARARKWPTPASVGTVAQRVNEAAVRAGALTAPWTRPYLCTAPQARGPRPREAIGAGEEGVGVALAAHGGFGSMTAVHDGRIGQRKQLALDTPEQRLRVAPRQIRTTDRALEQHVAREHHAFPFEDDAAG